MKKGNLAPLHINVAKWFVQSGADSLHGAAQIISVVIAVAEDEMRCQAAKEFHSLGVFNVTAVDDDLDISLLQELSNFSHRLIAAMRVTDDADAHVSPCRLGYQRLLSVVRC